MIVNGRTADGLDILRAKVAPPDGPELTREEVARLILDGACWYAEHSVRLLERWRGTCDMAREWQDHGPNDRAHALVEL